MSHPKPTEHEGPEAAPDRPTVTNPADDDRAALVALFRLLVKEPPTDHDFHTCPICKRYGITKI